MSAFDWTITAFNAVIYLSILGTNKRIKAEAKNVRIHMSKSFADHRQLMNKLRINSTYGKAGSND